MKKEVLFGVLALALALQACGPPPRYVKDERHSYLRALTPSREEKPDPLVAVSQKSDSLVQLTIKKETLPTQYPSAYLVITNQSTRSITFSYEDVQVELNGEVIKLQTYQQFYAQVNRDKKQAIRQAQDESLVIATNAPNGFYLYKDASLLPMQDQQAANRLVQETIYEASLIQAHAKNKAAQYLKGHTAIFSKPILLEPNKTVSGSLFLNESLRLMMNHDVMFTIPVGKDRHQFALK